MHENLHKNVNENMFSFTFLGKFSWSFKTGNKSNKCFTLLIFYMRKGGPIILDCIKFSQF